MSGQVSGNVSAISGISDQNLTYQELLDVNKAFNMVGNFLVGETEIDLLPTDE